MSDIKARDLVDALVRKGMQVDTDAKHHVMLKRRYKGGPTLISRISRGSRSGYDDYLLAQVAKQLALQLAELRQLIECPLSREDWDRIVAERCPDGVNPYAPFRRG